MGNKRPSGRKLFYDYFPFAIKKEAIFSLLFMLAYVKNVEQIFRCWYLFLYKRITATEKSSHVTQRDMKIYNIQQTASYSICIENEIPEYNGLANKLLM